MRIALAAVGFITGDTEYNKNKIIKTVNECRDKADLVLFGETFLQGFECLSWNYEKDRGVAVSQDDPLISAVRETAKRNNIAVSFGYVEKEGDRLYSSQLTLGRDGHTINNYRRVSVGWKESIADSHYCEGEAFERFEYEGRILSVGLCGDFWDDRFCEQEKQLKADIVLWPVYTDFNYNVWNSSMKYEYAGQSEKIGDRILYVNSVCEETEAEEIARGGAVYFSDGRIVTEVAAGTENVLIVDIE